MTSVQNLNMWLILEINVFPRANKKLNIYAYNSISEPDFVVAKTYTIISWWLNTIMEIHTTLF